MKNKARLSVIFVTVFIDLMGFGILIPILPTFASNQLGISDTGIGVIVGVFSLVQFLFNTFLGKLSDRIGRRPILLSTLLMTCSSYIIFSFSDSFFLLFLSRLIAGFGGSNIGVAQAYIADVTSKQERAKGMGMIGAAFGLGFVFGPIIGGLLSVYGYAVVGFASASFSLMAFLFAFFFLPESVKEFDKSKKLNFRIIDVKEIASVFANNFFVGMLIFIFFITIFSVANIYGTYSILGNKYYGFTDQQNGYLFGVMGIVGAVIQGGAIKQLSAKFSEKGLVLSGMGFMIAGLGFIPFGRGFVDEAVIVALLSVGTGIIQPTIMSMISKYSPDHEQGKILGMNQSLAALGRVFGPLWGGFSYDYFGYRFPFLTGALFTFLALIIAVYVLNSQNKSDFDDNGTIEENV